MPIFVAREWYRHTVGFSRNEVSRRYVDSAAELWIPDITELRARDVNMKQGSKDTPVEGAEGIVNEIRNANANALILYDSLLARNVAPEIARTVLPQSMYTEFIETASLAAYARLVGLRTDPHAQREIQLYAQVISDMLEPFFPVSWKALIQK